MIPWQSMQGVVMSVKSHECVVGQRYPHPPAAGCHGNDIRTWTLWLITMVAEPSFPYCISSCYGNLLQRSAKVGVYIHHFTHLYHTPTTTPTRAHTLTHTYIPTHTHTHTLSMNPNFL